MKWNEMEDVNETDDGDSEFDTTMHIHPIR